MERINEVLSGVLLPAALALLALFFIFYLRGRPFIGLRKELKSAGSTSLPGSSAGAHASARRAVLMALAGTLGVGNITGVADAIRRGGAGVLFWMWVSSFAAMIVKYAEILLLMKKRRDQPSVGSVGPMIYMRPAAASVLFSIFGLLCAFSVGSSLQASAVSSSFFLSFGWKPAVTCAALSLPVLILVLRRKTDLFALTAVIVPLMSAAYLCLCLVVIVRNAGELPALFKRIVSEAFSFGCAPLHGSALAGFTALRFGVIRGLLSNEAGCGTAPIAHAHSSSEPSSQASLGVIEVAVDTLLLCTATGFAVLLCPANGAGAMESVFRALSSVFGRAAVVLLPAALYSFAFATMLCWSLYTEVFAGHLFSFLAARFALPVPLAVDMVKILFCLFCACSFLLPERLLWQTADLSVSAMTLINLFFLFTHRKELLPAQKQKQKQE